MRTSDLPVTPIAALHTDDEWAAMLANATPGPTTVVRPPHFPDPSADPIAVLEARIREQDEMIAEAHREAKAWQAQLEAALARIGELEREAEVLWDEAKERDAP